MLRTEAREGAGSTEVGGGTAAPPSLAATGTEVLEGEEGTAVSVSMVPVATGAMAVAGVATAPAAREEMGEPGRRLRGQEVGLVETEAKVETAKKPEMEEREAKAETAPACLAMAAPAEKVAWEATGPLAGTVEAEAQVAMPAHSAMRGMEARVETAVAEASVRAEEASEEWADPLRG